jgi:transcriptional regulator with XRE-family HTH domain
LCMAGTNGVTPRSKALGDALKQRREAADIKVTELARKLGWDHTRISRYESGQRSPRLEDIATYLTAIGVTGEEYDDVLKFAREGGQSDQPHWLGIGSSEQNRQLAVLLRYEEVASEIIDVSPLLVPGLLQTSDYARAIMRDGRVPEDQIATRVAARLGRRDTITRPRNPAKLLALIGENALHQAIGGAQVMADQLRHIEAATRAPNITVRVMPLSASWHTGLEGPALLVVPDTRSDLQPVVHLEGRRSGVFLSRQQDIDAYMEGVEMVLNVALTEADSVDVIAREAARWEGMLDAVEEVQP